MTSSCNDAETLTSASKWIAVSYSIHITAETGIRTNSKVNQNGSVIAVSV